MTTRYAAHPADVKHYDTARLRQEFLADNLVVPGRQEWVYSHYDRFVFGAIVPTDLVISLGNFPQLKADYFLERRELGVLNLGGAGSIIVDGTTYIMDPYDCLYVGRGAQTVSFASDDAAKPALFYANSTPAHKTYPTTRNSQADANVVHLGSNETANDRTLYQYIHEGGIPSCQLVMGFTELAPGNVWNTFPPHTHARRMEVYFYFDFPEDQVVLHLMGQPDETRHLFLANNQAVISPDWSIHSGAGTVAYKFVWGMGGENQSFNDMDGVALRDVR
ncbi:MAG: 5-dehydro-4-deoxy-D-glucuronate isomerase [Bacteroidota bacterium]